MTTILHIDSSARSGISGEDAYGTHTRRLIARFVRRLQQASPDSRIVYRDVGQNPPAPVSGRWIHAAFTPSEAREPWMNEVLRESDALVNELIAADIIVAGVPMYNFAPPAQFKAYIDNIVRVGRTFGFDRNRSGKPYWPMLAGSGKRLLLLSSRGDYGYDSGQADYANHVEASVRTAFAYIGITDVQSIAAEYDEFGGERLQQSLSAAESAVDRLADEWLAQAAG